MSFTESNTVEQMILDAATSLGSGAVGVFQPRIKRMSTDRRQSVLPIRALREIRGSTLSHP